MRLMTAQLTRLALFSAVVTATAVATAANVSTEQPTDHSAEMQNIQQLTWSADVPALKNVCRQFDAVTPVSADAQTRYVAAYCDYRVAYIGNKNPSLYAADMEQALARSELRLQALSETANAYQAESLALLSSVYGMEIALTPSKGATLGAKADKAIAQAEALDGQNPRVQLFKGLGKLFTPVMYGGDKAVAINAFDLAIAALPAARSDAVNWGLEDAYIWRSIALRDSDMNAAKHSLELALSIAPNHGWALRQLAELNQMPSNRAQ